VRAAAVSGGVRVGLLLAAVAATTLLGSAGSAHADNPVLTGDVGANDSFTIALTDASGAKVTHLDPGTYTLVVHDRSAIHNFHLSGPGVDASSTIPEVADKTFTVTLADGTYFFDCDAHPAQMKGSFTVGAVATPPPAATKLAASFGPGSAFALAPRTGVKAGKATITVRDRSKSDGFRLSGPGVNKTTGAAFTGTVTWRVTLTAGRYSFGSARFAKSRKALIVSA
jgi:hypothetical protein